jgi:mono/diheme cytochrome c family protein
MMKHTCTWLMIAVVCVLIACSPAKDNRTGHEFMPDMVHTIGYEANLYNYYSYNRWGTEAEYKVYASPRTSVSGTVARGEVSAAGAQDMNARMTAMGGFTGEGDGAFAYTPNGSVPYYYADTEQERQRASREITANPFPITDMGLTQGKELYNIYCGICHGEKGDGLGYLVRDEDPAKGIPAGVYPAAPANLLQDTFVLASAGRIYHAIMHGKNVMGSYADKLSYRERWDVIHYIRSLQAQSKKMEYSPISNTFNNEAAPWSVVEASMKKGVQAPADTTEHAGMPGGSHGNSKQH